MWSESCALQGWKRIHLQMITSETHSWCWILGGKRKHNYFFLSDSVFLPRLMSPLHFSFLLSAFIVLHLAWHKSNLQSSNFNMHPQERERERKESTEKRERKQMHYVNQSKPPLSHEKACPGVLHKWGLFLATEWRILFKARHVKCLFFYVSARG